MTPALFLCIPVLVIPSLWLLYGRLLDAAGEAEWAEIERRYWRDDGPSTDVMMALRADIYRRSDMLGAMGRGKP